MKTQTESKIAISARKFTEDGEIIKKTIRVSPINVQEETTRLSEEGFEITRTHPITVNAISYMFREVPATAEHPAQEIQLLDFDGQFILRHTVYGTSEPVMVEVTLSENLDIVTANTTYAAYAKENDFLPQFQAEDLTLYVGHTYAAIL